MQIKAMFSLQSQKADSLNPPGCARIVPGKTKGRKMINYFKLIALGLITLFAMMAANYARDVAYLVHALIITAVSGGLFIWVLRGIGTKVSPAPSDEYFDSVVRAGGQTETLKGNDETQVAPGDIFVLKTPGGGGYGGTG